MRMATQVLRARQPKSSVQMRKSRLPTRTTPQPPKNRFSPLGDIGNIGGNREDVDIAYTSPT